MDLSLRANADEYIDRDKESEKIINRIESDSSTVIGISGLRGAGKSSLAKKVLDESTEKGYFTLLIHSPTAYESREFLITIFSRICESVIRNLESKFGVDNTLEGKAASIVREIKIYIRTIFIGAIIFVVSLLGVFYYAYSKQMEERYNTEQIEYEKEIDADLQKANSKLETLNKATPLDSIRSLQITEMEGIIETIENRKELLRESKYSRRAGYITESAITISIGLFTYAFLIFAYFLIRPRLLLRKKIRRYSKEYGLYKIAQENLEYLKFQSTVSNSRETQANIWKFSSKLTKNKSLQTRPISLPGLTSDLSIFLDYVSDIFNNKVVICLDELDKINDAEQLDNLLKGIKGILGQKNVYFILTVSEDALSNFVTRLRGERNLIESSFEEIIHLERINSSLALKIIDNSLEITSSQNNTNNNVVTANKLLVWAFSGGIPRELKRNILKLRDSELNIQSSSIFTIWQYYFQNLIHNMRNWVLISDFDEEEKKETLIILDEIIQIIPKEVPDEPKCFSIKLLAKINSIKKDNSDFLDTTFFKEKLLEKSILDALISSMFIIACENPSDELEANMSAIQKQLSSVPYSSSYTKIEISRYLKNNNWLQQ